MEYEMTPKDEYLALLSQALFGRMKQSAINAQIRYYENYILEQVAKGEDEQQVLEKLGSPQALAKSLCQFDKIKPAGEEVIVEPARKNRFFEASKSRGFNMTDEDKYAKNQSSSNERSYSENDQYLEGYNGVKAEFDKEEGWKVEIGGFRLNSWYGTLLIAGVIIAIYIIINVLR